MDKILIAGASGKIGSYLFNQLNQNYSVKALGRSLNFNTKDKSGVRDYIDVGDIVKAHYFSLQKLKKTKKPFYIINLGSKTFYSAKQILELIRKFLEIKKVRIVYSVKKKGEPDKLLASSQLASSFLKWKPKIKISESLKNMILWEKYKIKQKKLFYK